MQLTRDPCALVGHSRLRALLALMLQLRRSVRQLAHIAAAHPQHPPKAPCAHVEKPAEDEVIERAIGDHEAGHEERDDQRRGNPRPGRVDLPPDREAAQEPREGGRHPSLVLESPEAREADHRHRKDRQRPAPPPRDRRRGDRDQSGGGDGPATCPPNPDVELAGDHQDRPEQCIDATGSQESGAQPHVTNVANTAPARIGRVADPTARKKSAGRTTPKWPAGRCAQPHAGRTWQPANERSPVQRFIVSAFATAAVIAVSVAVASGSDKPASTSKTNALRS